MIQFHRALLACLAGTVTACAPLTFSESAAHDGDAAYLAITPDGTVVDRGTEADTSEFPDEVVEDVLDEIALHYIRPYRL
jgi:hypothetical protein